MPSQIHPDIMALLLSSPLAFAISPESAADDGFWPLTVPYEPAEYGWLAAVCADIQKAGNRFAVVCRHGAPEVWRDGERYDDDHPWRAPYDPAPLRMAVRRITSAA